MTGLLSSGATVQLIQAADLRAAPWKNGGGITREVVTQPAGASFDHFLWRISLADVEQDGPFSMFDGIDRVLTVIQGGPMILSNKATGATHTVFTGQPLQFAGEDTIYASLPDGPIKDHNLMWRRGHALGSTQVHRQTQQLQLTTGSTVLHCAVGSYRISAPADQDQNTVLEQGDTLILTLPDAANQQLDIAPLQQDAVLLDSRIHRLPNPYSPGP